MNTKIIWAGGIALLGVAAVVALLSTAGAETLPLASTANGGAMTPGQRTQLQSIAAPCMTFGFGGFQWAEVNRVVDDQGIDHIMLTISDRHQLTRAQARAWLASGKPLLPNRFVEAQNTCELTENDVTTLNGVLVPAFWPNAATWTYVRIARNDGPPRVVAVRGVTTRDLDAAVTDSENGSAIEPVGVAVP